MIKRGVGAALAVVGITGVLVRRAVRGEGSTGRPGARDRWHAVTVNLPPEEVGTAPPGQLAELGDSVTVRIQPGPRRKGTELHARLTGGPDAPAEQEGALRSALREEKQLLETGEVLAPTRPGSIEPTPLNAPLRLVTAHGREEGRL